MMNWWLLWWWLLFFHEKQNAESHYAMLLGVAQKFSASALPEDNCSNTYTIHGQFGQVL